MIRLLKSSKDKLPSLCQYKAQIEIKQPCNSNDSNQVSTQVQNTITLDSFISTVTTMTLISGIVFELPIVVYFLTKIGLLTPIFMRTYRRHAVVVILILAAVITPTSDATTLVMVALPLYVLYEISIFVSAYVLRSKTAA